MARPIWKGMISFGLVSVPVSLYPAEQSHQLRGERDHEQRHEHRAGKAGEFPEQRALKDHAILSLWNLA